MADLYPPANVEESATVTVLYILYFAPLVWVLYDYSNYPVGAAAVVVAVTAAHFVAGILEHWNNFTQAARLRYTGRFMWYNITADILITSAFLLGLVSLVDDDDRVLLSAAITAIVGNLFCVLGRALKKCT